MRKNIYLFGIILLIAGIVMAYFINHKQVAEADLVELPSTFEELSIMSPVVVKDEMIGVGRLLF